MDLQTAVAASMLPTSRSTVAAAFKQLRHDHGIGAQFLEFLWAAAGRAELLGPPVILEILDSAARALDNGVRRGIEPIAVFDPRYPALLGCTADPPPVLWTRGNLDVLARPTVAVVGSRAASPYALQVGTRLGGELAEHGVLVASGLARGVDSAAHRGCMKAGGPTVAVLGSGLDRVYPPEHDTLATEIAQTGLLLAELAPGAAPLPEHFPLRNRIISGISLATVVVEASEKSGSLITARCALEQGRDVMAVPGSVLSGRNRGSHGLLKDGATVVETADDILQELGWISAGARAVPAKSLISEPLLGQMEPGEPYELDELASATGISGARLLARLTELELAGFISVAGGRFLRLL
jgi:DNA processing protein